MTGLEAIETINSWRRILIEGNPDNVDRMLSDVESRLRDNGWQRDSDTEAKMGGPPDRKNPWICFAGGPADGPQLLLCLKRVSGRRVRGGAYSLISESASVQPTDVAGVVEGVVRDVLTPSASNFHVKVTIPQLGRNSRVSPRTLAALRSFSDLAAGEWPLSIEGERLWRRFVITACREDTAFDIDELSDWFVTNGWASDVANELTDRFISEASLIAEYNDEAASGQ